MNTQNIEHVWVGRGYIYKEYRYIQGEVATGIVGTLGQQEVQLGVMGTSDQESFTIIY